MIVLKIISLHGNEYLFIIIKQSDEIIALFVSFFQYSILIQIQSCLNATTVCTVHQANHNRLCQLTLCFLFCELLKLNFLNFI